MKYVSILAIILAGCSSPNEQPTGWGEKRIELFESCMMLAQVNQASTHYSPNQKVVNACGTQSYYMANGLKNSGYFDGDQK